MFKEQDYFFKWISKGDTMTKKTSMLNLLLSVVTGKVTGEDKQKTEQIIESSIGEDYDNYLKKPSEYHDMVIKRMYRNTEFANESPERLREILRAQVSDEGLAQ